MTRLSKLPSDPGHAHIDIEPALTGVSSSLLPFAAFPPQEDKGFTRLPKKPQEPKEKQRQSSAGVKVGPPKLRVTVLEIWG